jgi:hypothetical protein
MPDSVEEQDTRIKAHVNFHVSVYAGISALLKSYLNRMWSFHP